MNQAALLILLIGVLAIVGCASATPAPTPKNVAKATMQSTVWLHEGNRIAGLVGSTMFHWDRKMDKGRGGIVGRSVATGKRLHARPIPDLRINGDPDFWLPGPAGGYLTAWDEPMFIADEGGKLSIRWRSPKARWGVALTTGDKLVVWQYAPGQAVVALSPTTGKELWRATLERHANGVELRFDGQRVYAIWQQYSATAPTPTVVVPQRVSAIDADTGKRLWTHNFREHTGGIAVTRDHIMVAKGASLHIIEGATGLVHKSIPTGHSPNVYPRFAVSGAVVYVGLWDAVSAYEIPSGRTLWRHTVALDGGPELVVGGNKLFVTTGHGSVVAIDRKTGRRTWEVGTGINAYRMHVSDKGVVVVASNSGAGFALPVTAARQKVTIYGQVQARCLSLDKVVLAVGDQRVKPDARGNYVATVEMVGIVLIHAPGAGMPEPEHPDRARIVLRGQREYEVPLLTLNFCQR